ncbi:MAG: hypothetical protein Fues2KO_27780 [Fuerstiella sp.]
MAVPRGACFAAFLSAVVSGPATVPELLRTLLVLLPLFVASSARADDEPVGVVDHPALNECSGIAASYENESCLWLHNDSGDGPHLYLVTETGSLQAKVVLQQTTPFDWEDMCSFQVDGQSWLLIGDVGDNLKARGRRTPKCRLLLVREPHVSTSDKVQTLSWPVHSGIEFVYEDGLHDCEAIAVDVARREILLLTKTAPTQCGLYRLPLDLDQRDRSLTAERIASPFVLLATAMDISPDSSSLAIGNMWTGLLVRRDPQESWADACGRVGQHVHLPPRRQGETICFDRSGRWLCANSEGTNQPLWKIPLPSKSLNPRPKGQAAGN